MNTEEKAQELYPNNKTFCGGVAQIARDAFINGARMQRDEMMMGVVEGEITKDNRGNNVFRAGVLNNGFEVGDKVKIIIVKEENK